MIKGIVAAIFGALLVAAIIVGLIWLVASGVFLAIFGFIVGAVVIAAILMFFLIFLFAVIIFFAVFYYMAEKSPTVTPGEYKLSEEKGKNE